MKFLTNILRFIPLFIVQLDKVLSVRFLAFIILLTVAGLGAAALGIATGGVIIAGWEAYAEIAGENN